MTRMDSVDISDQGGTGRSKGMAPRSRSSALPGPIKERLTSARRGPTMLDERFSFPLTGRDRRALHALAHRVRMCPSALVRFLIREAEDRILASSGRKRLETRAHG